ncbi:hypothetical protein [Sphaerisporangium siamense]|uniref:Uncharacterized protein n=1 Tax=Sphaerisporangium siamense TaxID=795645 RepID=A0A7W7DBI9_9ACTN|nr:hypothetical protein [Sphaerisporangium siamense]MBB4702561.1 hypothetical protein [Sphaerisporangium siamense]
MSIADFADDGDYSNLSPAQRAALQAVGKHVAQAIQPSVQAVMGQIGRQLAEVNEQAVKSLAQAIGSSEMFRQIREIGEALQKTRLAMPDLGQLGRAGTAFAKLGPAGPDYAKFGPALPVPPPLDLPDLTGAYRLMTQNPGPPPEARSFVEVVNQADADVIGKAAEEILTTPELRQAIEEVVDELPAETEEQAVSLGWALCLAVFWGMTIPIPYAVALDSKVHPILDSAMTSLALAVAVTGLYLAYGRSSKD